jgi:hypothetical protein
MRSRLTDVTMTLTLVALATLVDVEPGNAHKPITSPYTYTDDVLPILRDRCGRCHVSGGVAPMSLMTHTDAVPWGESIRTEVLAGHMPPGSVDEAPARFRNATGLSPREMNLLLTWVTGGTPIGSPGNTPPPATREDAWPLGPPDLALPLPEAIVPADTREQTSEFIVATGLTERRWVRAVDLLPGNAAMVRRATVAVRSPALATGGAAIERTLALWLPGEDPLPLDAGYGFELPASAELVVRVLYRKTWEYERHPLRDRSTVGIYFGQSSAIPVQAINLAADGGRVIAAADRVAFRRVLTEDARALAIYPQVGSSNTTVKVVATRPDGTRADLIAFHPRPGWEHRYWFREPIPLPRGTMIEVTAAVDDEASLLPLSLPPSPTAPDLSAVRLMLNVVR